MKIDSLRIDDHEDRLDDITARLIRIESYLDGDNIPQKPYRIEQIYSRLGEIEGVLSTFAHDGPIAEKVRDIPTRDEFLQLRDLIMTVSSRLARLAARLGVSE